MKKHIILLTLLLLPMLASAQEKAQIGDLVYNIYKENGTAEVIIKGYEWDDYYPDGIVIPSSVTYQGVNYPVTSIGDHAFYGGVISSLTIPNSVTRIGNKAFMYCESLKSLTIPNSVTRIGEGAFSFCESLKSLTIPNSVTRIGDAAFSYCESLESLVIPSSIMSIPYGLFYGCKSLTSVTVPNSLNAIDESAFYGCTALATITIPESVTTLGRNAFKDCSALTSVTIPNSVKRIEGGTFQGCTALKSVTIGADVEYIGGSAFFGCTSLETVDCLVYPLPQTESNTFLNSNIKNATLKLPSSGVDYSMAPWNEFKQVVETKRCVKPVITYADGIVKATSPTEGSHCTIKCEAGITHAGTNSVNLHILLVVEAYATADGYEQSLTATEKFQIKGIDDLSGDYKLSIEDLTRLVSRIKEQNKK